MASMAVSIFNGINIINERCPVKQGNESFLCREQPSFMAGSWLDPSDSSTVGMLGVPVDVACRAPPKPIH